MFLTNERLLINVIEQLIGPDIAGNPILNLRTKTPQNEATTVPWHQGRIFIIHSKNETTHRLIQMTLPHFVQNIVMTTDTIDSERPTTRCRPKNNRITGITHVSVPAKETRQNIIKNIRYRYNKFY